ncbi:hypothetical protein HDU67_000655, partial [Dinochytrium kinnereticum]
MTSNDDDDDTISLRENASTAPVAGPADAAGTPACSPASSPSPSSSSPPVPSSSSSSSSTSAMRTLVSSLASAARNAYSVTCLACSVLRSVPWASLSQDAILSASPLALMGFFSLLESSRTSLSLTHITPLLPAPLHRDLHAVITASLTTLSWFYPLLSASLLLATFLPNLYTLLQRHVTANDKKPKQQAPPPLIVRRLRTALTAAVLVVTGWAIVSLNDLAGHVGDTVRTARLARVWELNDPAALVFHRDPRDGAVSKSLLGALPDEMDDVRTAVLREEAYLWELMYPSNGGEEEGDVRCPVSLKLVGEPYIRFQKQRKVDGFLPDGFVDPGVL